MLCVKCGVKDIYHKREQICRSCFGKKNISKLRINKQMWRKKHLRREHLATRYGITLDDYDKMFKEQQGRCAICGKEPNKTGRCRNFAVDHDHETNTIRGLLCIFCNRNLGVYEKMKANSRTELYLQKTTRVSV